MFTKLLAAFITLNFLAFVLGTAWFFVLAVALREYLLAVEVGGWTVCAIGLMAWLGTPKGNGRGRIDGSLDW